MTGVRLNPSAVFIGISLMAKDLGHFKGTYELFSVSENCHLPIFKNGIAYSLVKSS